MSTHLATRGGIACHTEARWPARSAALTDVTCKRCVKRVDAMHAEESVAAFERTRLTRSAADCAELGVAHLWAALAADDTPTGRMLRDMFGAIARYLIEQQPVAAEVRRAS